ncbi:MAG: O-antigen ligase family protein [Anaerolineaceae bacterium]|nr:O-antigen ligase family protein [Anaerolineaceae bacterium]
MLIKLHSLDITQIITGLCCGIIFGVASFFVSPLWVLVGLICALCTYLIVRKPEIGLLGYLLITSTIIDENSLPRFSIGIGRLVIPDLILFFLFGLILFKIIIFPDFKFIHSSLDLPILAFVTVALFSTFLAIQQHSVTLNQSLGEVRVILSYLTFFIVTNLIRKKDQLNFLIKGLFLLAAVVSIGMIVQFLLGNSVQILPGRVEDVSTQNIGITRILPPGQSLIYVVLICLIGLLIFDKGLHKSIPQILPTILVGFAVVLTFNRSFWVGIGIAVVFLLVLVGNENRKRFVLGTFLVVLLVGFIITVIQINPATRVSKLITAFTTRVTSLVSGDLMGEPSLQSRFIENGYAFQQMLEHPILGLGLGSNYRPFDPRLDWENYDGRAYIHNGQFWIILKTGFLGYACFLLFTFIFIWRGLKYWKTILDVDLKAIYLTFILAYLGIFAASTVNPVFTQANWSPIFGIMFGINESILLINKSQSLQLQEQENSN